MIKCTKMKVGAKKKQKKAVMSSMFLLLIDSTVLEVVFDEHVSDRAQGEPHVVRVSCASDVEVYLGPLLFDRLELVGDKLEALVILLGPGVLGERNRDRLPL